MRSDKASSSQASTRVLAIVGPTAAGKTELALDVAETLGAEIVSVDSAQIYRGMNIGTAKPDSGQLLRVPHHMVNEIDPGQSITVADFRDRARTAISGIVSRGRIPLLVGGSGLYFRAVVDPLEFPGTQHNIRARLSDEAEESDPDALFERLAEKDPEAASRIDRRNVRRVIRALEVIELTGRKFSEFRTAWDLYESIYRLSVVGLTLPLDKLDERINERVDEQMRNGLLEEVIELKSRGMLRSVTSVQALGYAQLLSHLEGQGPIEEAVEAIKARTRRFARRQLTWFRADPRVRWFEDDPKAAANLLREEASA